MTSNVSLSYQVESWSQVSYRYHIGWKIGLKYRICIISDRIIKRRFYRYRIDLPKTLYHPFLGSGGAVYSLLHHIHSLSWKHASPFCSLYKLTSGRWLLTRYFVLLVVAIESVIVVSPASYLNWFLRMRE